MNLWRYIQGFQKGKEAHRIEKEAMKDPFLADALEGYEQVKGDHSKQIKSIRKNLPRPTPQNIYSNQVLGVVACLVVLICAVSFLYVYRSSFKSPNKVMEFIDPRVSGGPEPGVGWEKYEEYLEKELRQPSDECKGVKGRVKLRFQVNKEGRPENFKILRSLCTSADEEAIRVVRAGSTWTTEEQTVEIEIGF